MSGPLPAMLRELVRGPGADDRVWCRHVVLTTDPVAEPGGVYADGRVEPEGTETTVRLRPLYVAPGCGLYLPHAKGDLLVCVFPEGSPGGGAVEVCPLPSDEDTVPQEEMLKPLDLWLVVQAGRDVRIKVGGPGVVRIEAAQIHLRTTGSAATSKVIIDGVPWSGLQLSTPAGPTVGPPRGADPSGAAALSAYQAWLSAEGEQG